AKKLNRMGIYMAGFDVVEEQIIEINVTSPCYFIKEINNNFCVNIETQICDYILGLAGLQCNSRLLGESKKMTVPIKNMENYEFKTEII
ncbi:MAG: hypothetical protein LUB59_01945, partial [Candidatus Gastranaerophilales bacterium]|nr:hypothetical protein [Candidatus Gastranaerophilales bacterium]